MDAISLMRRIASALLFAALVAWPLPGAIAGEGRIDASNGDIYFNVHFRFPPTTQQIADVKAAIDMMSVGVCDATDGQMRVKRVTLSQGESNEDKGDFWLHALPGRSGVSFFFNGANLGTLGSHVDMFSGAMLVPDIYLHEFGHHAWGLGDEYDEQNRWGGPCGIGPGFDPGTIDEQNHSIMQQSGSAQCVGGSRATLSCLRNSDCPGAGGGPAGTCQLVLMSELSVASNHDPLQGNAASCPAVTPMCTDNAYCTRAYNTTTNRYEQTQQSDVHADASDWETLAENYPFVTPPVGLPVAVAPATCSRVVEYTEDVRGSDQVLLLLDRSGSMSWSSNPADGEVCDNGVDDDGDGAVDEPTCGNARITFVTAAANAYLDLQRDRNVDVGILTFNETPTLIQAIGTLNAGNIATYKGIVAGLTPGGNTGIGDALDASVPEFTRVATLGRSRTAYLMTDGYNTSGVDPVAAAERLRDIGVRVHVIPAGSDVSETQLGGVAAATKGDVLAAPGLNDLTAIYAELAGRHRGAAMALPRTNFELSLRGKGGEEFDRTQSRFPLRQRAFPIFVENKAKSLVAFVSGRNSRMSEWSIGISLVGPNGETFGPGSPELTVNPFYLFIDVLNPAPGEWKLVAAATGPALQKATALAFIENPEPDFFVSARPTIIADGEKVRIAATPLYVSRLEGQGVSISGNVEGPVGFTAPLSMTRNESGAWSADAGPFPHDGFYRATLALNVDTTAALAPGESIFEGPATPPVSITPFKRFASAGFIVVKGEARPCESGNPKDCDGDGIPDPECANFGPDIDKDGRPNGRDPDADGDEIPDAIERNVDLNRNGIPDMCEPSKPRTAAPPRPQRVRSACVPIRRSLIEPRLVGRNWRLNDGNVSLFDFGRDEKSARLALEVLNRYSVTDLCYVGRRGHSFSYLLAEGKAPTGSIAGETCKGLDADGVSIAEEQGVYALKLRGQTLRTFAERAEADGALAAILKYGFTNLCVVGKGRESLEYMRR
jgi:hypothetical protein